MSDESETGPAGGDEPDGGLLAELRLLASRHDPVPERAIAAARSAIAWRTLDAELAELTADSSTDAELATVRTTADERMLTFRSAALTVELEVLQDAGRRRILGQLVPPGPARIEVRHPGGTATVEADAVGRFSAGDVAPGPVSLRCAGDGGAVETDWFLA